MDRRTLLAVVLIMGVLLVDQVLWSKWNRARHPAAPTGTGAPAVPGAPDKGASPGAGALGAGAAGAARSSAAESVAMRASTGGGDGGDPIVAARVPSAPAMRGSLCTGPFHASLTGRW